MFSVGDLVDRGPKSLECLHLLKEPWFHAVKGNHEELMQDYVFGGPSGAWWMRNGGSWWNALTTEERKEATEIIDKKVTHLPLMITVVDQFHVLHAELSCDEQATDENMADEDWFKAAALEMGMDGASVIWGRNLFTDIAFRNRNDISDTDVEWLKHSSFTRMFGPKLSQIYCGHTVTQQPTKIMGQTNLDTGAFITGKRSWAGLTFAEPINGKFWKVTDDVTPVELLVLV